MAVEKRDVEVEGLPIRYLTAGSGPPLLLLHGAGDNSLDWQWVMPDLAATHRVYAPDLPGSPDSARPTAEYSPTFFEPALPHLKREGRGALIHISSVEAKRSFPFHSAYGASKHGIDGFLEALRVELKHEGWPISVTQVMPGTINTPFFDKGRTKLGVKPVGIPPIYEPETVANMIVYAAENPARDLVSGGAAQAMIINQRLSPRMVDAILATRAGFSPQMTDEPRSEDDPDNLYAPIRGHDTAKNGFRALSRSFYNWLQMHPTVRRGAVAGMAIGLFSALRRRP